MTVRPPRTSRWVASAWTVAGAMTAGAVVGTLWALVAPPVHGVVALTRSGDRVQAYLGNEADHFFVAPALLLSMLGVAAVVAATLTWQWRAHRGPGMVGALSAGLIGAAGLAVLTGAGLVHCRYGAVDADTAPVSPEHRVFYVTEAPPVFFGHSPPQVAATLLLPAAVAALIYGLCAASDVRDDLGGYPAEPLVTPSGPPPGR